MFLFFDEIYEILFWFFWQLKKWVGQMIKDAVSKFNIKMMFVYYSKKINVTDNLILRYSRGKKYFLVFFVRFRFRFWIASRENIHTSNKQKKKKQKKHDIWLVCFPRTFFWTAEVIGFWTVMTVLLGNFQVFWFKFLRASA